MDVAPTLKAYADCQAQAILTRSRAGSVLDKPTASARHGAIQVPTLTSWQACQRHQGYAMIKLTIKLSISYKQVRSLLFLLMLLGS